VGLIDKPILRAVKAAGFTGLTFGLLGCAAQDVAAPDTVDNAQATTETTVEKPVEFSTIGKPTKTIETPWGPKEVYDPIQDEEVRAAFKRIFDRDDGVVHFEYFGGGKEVYVTSYELDDFGNKQLLPNGVYKKALTLREPETNDLIVMNSLIQQRREYLSLSCLKLIESSCNKTFLYVDDCGPYGAPCYRVKHPTQMCQNSLVDGNRYYDRTSHPIGTQFFDMTWLMDGGQKTPLPAPHYEAQIENYFMIKCSDW